MSRARKARVLQQQAWRAVVWLVFSALVLSFVDRATAQSTFGNIVGVVQDNSGATVGGAEVSVRGLEDNSVRTVASDAAGTFTVGNLKPGRYEVFVSKAGFDGVRVESIELTAREERRLEVKLSPASVKQTVLVSGEASTINTENGTIADSKDFVQVTTLPSNYRGNTGSPLGAIVTVPGVQQDSNGQLSIGGGLPAMIDFTVDGVSTVNIRNNGPNTNMYPSSELLGEFRVTGVNNNAEFAQVADVTVTTKSGTNNFHGSAFEYLQNSALDAQTYGSGEKQHKAYNTFGASLGGPVAIPRFYQGRDKTFFFLDYEGSRLKGSTLQQYLVPTQAERNGDLTDLGGPVLDPSQINTVSAELLSLYYPLPNANLNGVNYIAFVPTPVSSNGYDVRVDHAIGTHHQIFGRWSWKNLEVDKANTLLPTSRIAEQNRNLIVSHNWIIRSNLLNEFRFGISKWTSTEKFPLNGTAAVEGLGITGLNLENHPESGAFPIFDFSTGTGFTVIGRGKDGPTRSETYQFVDNFSWTKGRHTLKFGADIRRVKYTDVQHFGGADDFGDFPFYGVFTGNAFADFLEGFPTLTYFAVTGPDLVSPAWRYGIYGQDEFQVNRRLTINLGLRWEFNPPFDEANGNITNFDRATNSIITPDHTLPPSQAFLYSVNACPGVVDTLPCSPIVTASQEHLPAGLRQNYLRNFAPRVSIAYRPFGNDKTVVRGGIGVFTQALTGSSAYVLTGIHATDTELFFNSDGNGLPLYQFPAASAGSSISPALAGTGEFIVAQDPHFRDPSSLQWNVTVERELPGASSFRASYIGMNSYRLPIIVDLNQVHPSTTGYDASQKPYQNWGRVLSLDNVAFANYQALQLEFNHRSRKGLFLQTSYRFAKNLTNANGDTPGGFAPEYGAIVADRFDQSSNRGNDPGTRRHRFLATAIYELPVGRGARFFSGLNSGWNAVLGGWQLSTITLVETGPYLTPTVSAAGDPANINTNGRLISVIRPDLVGSATGNVSNPTPDHWFDINAFTETPANAGRLGNAGVGTLRGPGTVTAAVGLAKVFALTEHARLRFEASFTNLFNHPNLAPPQTNISNPATFGVTNSVQTAENSGNRTGQLALRLEF